MVEPYRMVIVNAIASIILLGLFFIYKFKFPKKPLPYPLIIFLLSLLPLISLLRKGSYESGDLWIHVVRLIDFYNSLKEGVWIPNWAANLNAGFGYPIFIFDAPLQYYISSIFHFAGISFIASVKLLIALAFVLSGLATYFWARNKFGKNAGLVAAIFYIFSPYHLVNMHFRVSVGELLLFSLMPLAFLTTDKLLENFNPKRFIANSILVGFIILSSPTSIIVLTFLGFYLMYFTFKLREIKKSIVIILSYVFGLMLSAFYWLPVLAEGRFTHQADFHTTVTFQSISNLFYKSYVYGMLYQGHKGELSFIIGFIQLVLIITVIFFLSKHEVIKYKNYLRFFLTSLLITLFLITSYSKFFWDIFSLYNNLQFSYRLMLIVSFMTAALAAIISIKFSPRLIFIICSIAVFSTVLNWGNRKVIPNQDDRYFRSILPYSTAKGEGGVPASPRWTDSNNLWQSQISEEKLEVISGKSEIQEKSRTSIRHSYIVKVTKSSRLKENTLYFPGWKVYANGKSLNIDYTNSSPSGIINFSLNPGKYQLEIVFQDTNVRKLGKFISAFSILLLMGIYLVLKRQVRI